MMKKLLNEQCRKAKGKKKHRMNNKRKTGDKQVPDGLTEEDILSDDSSASSASSSSSGISSFE